MICIGIDISKYKHDCFIATKTTHVQFLFKNNQFGFEVFLKELTKFPKEQLLIGLEATGHYGENLKAFLSSNSFTFMEINPFLIKKFSQANSLRKTKTDKKDAQLISKYMKTVTYKAYYQQSYHINALKSLTRFRTKLISKRTSHYNLLTKKLDVLFPEFKAFMGQQGYSKTALYIIEKYINHLKE